MSLPRRPPRPLLVAGLLGLVGLVGALAGCGTGTAAAPVAAVSARPQVDRALHDMLPAEVLRDGVLHVGTDASYAPASSFAEDGRTIVGFEPDLMAAIGSVLGVTVQMEDKPFDGLLADVSGARLDLAVSAMTDTPERQKVVDFVDYFTAGTAIVVRRGNPLGVHELDDLCGQAVSVERGTVQVDLLHRAQPHCRGQRITVEQFPDSAQATLQLRLGKVAAALTDYPPAVELANAAKTRAFFQLAADTQYEPGLYGVAVSPERPLLRDAVQGAFERLIESGEYGRVLQHWQVQQGAVAQPSVNGAARS